MNAFVKTARSDWRSRQIASVAAVLCGTIFGVTAAFAQATPSLSKYTKSEEAAEAVAVWNGPTEPAIAPKDKFLVVISCTWAVAGCKAEAEGAEEAAKAIGWRSKIIVVDNPTGYDQAMQTGINSGANAILLDGVDQAIVQGGIALAKKNKIPVVSVFQYNEPGEFGVDADVHPDGVEGGRMLADSAIVNSGGKIHALMLNAAEFSLPVTVLKSVKDEWAKCTQCEITYANEINFTSAVIGTTLPQQVVAAMRSDPKINTIIVGFDPPATFIVPAINAANLTDQAKMYSQLGNAAPLALVREGNVLVADVGASLYWGSWGGVDQIIRLMNGQPTVEQNVPVQLLSSRSVKNLPPEGKMFDGSASGFREKYLKLWGVE